MPLRYISVGSVLNRGLDRLVSHPNASSPLRPLKLFHTSRILQDDTGGHSSQNHYEALNVHPDASQSEIKKSYYKLSKLHHPDVNQKDPQTAARHFTRISEAYAVLSHAEKRARYDRDVLRRHHMYRHRNASGPAGGRPASGLSPRRTSRGTFHGPPPSFFRSGGWGAQASKRKAAHEESTGSTGSGYDPQTNTGRTASGAAGAGAERGGMGPGQRPYPSSHWNDDVPRHFDKESHERTHRRADERRAARMRERLRWGRDKRGDGVGEEEGDMARLVVVSGMLIFAIVAPTVAILTWQRFENWISGGGRRKEER